MGEGGKEDAERGKRNVERGDMKAEPHKLCRIELIPLKVNPEMSSNDHY